MATVPNFNYADRIQKYLDGDEGVLCELRDFRASHPKKFLAALRWAVGAKSDTFKRLDKLTRPGRGACEDCGKVGPVSEAGACEDCEERKATDEQHADCLICAPEEKA